MFADMFHKAIKLAFKEGTELELTFLTGEVKSYDMSVLFDDHPQLEALKSRDLFLKGRLIGTYGIIWNDELDIEAETIYADGITVRQVHLNETKLSLVDELFGSVPDTFTPEDARKEHLLKRDVSI